MLKIFTIVFCLSFFIQTCTNSSEPGDQNLTISELSIGDNDSLSHGAGIIIKFSNAIDLSSFNADTIYKQFDLYFSSPQGIETETINLDIYKIEASQSIKVNNTPSTFYYDPSTWTIALIEETTIQMPEGTGDGFYLSLDENNLVIAKNLKDVNGNSLANEIQIIIFKSQKNYRFNSVPNPSYFSTADNSSNILFTNLPSECTILIKDLKKTTLQNISHSGGGSELWDLRDQNDNSVGSGIYKFEITNSEINYHNGVFVVNEYVR